MGLHAQLTRAFVHGRTSSATRQRGKRVVLPGLPRLPVGLQQPPAQPVDRAHRRRPFICRRLCCLGGLIVLQVVQRTQQRRAGGLLPALHADHMQRGRGSPGCRFSRATTPIPSPGLHPPPITELPCPIHGAKACRGGQVGSQRGRHPPSRARLRKPLEPP